MVNWDLVRTVLGIIGNVTSFFLFASPMPTVWRIWKNKSVEGFHFYPYVAGIMNCIMWVFYSMPFVHPHSILVTTINSLGLVMYIASLIIYWVYTDNKKRKKISLYLLGEAVIFTALACVTLLVFHTHFWRSTFVGACTDVFSIILYASPLTIMWKVIKTKSVEFMPPMLSVAGFANGVIWSLYAFIHFDPYILVGNGTGAILAACQLVLYACYYSSTPKKDEKEATKPPQLVELEKYNGITGV